MPASRSHAVAVIGSFSARRAGEPDRGPRFLEVDRDSIDRVMAALEPSVEIAASSIGRLDLTSWGDFHPDQLVERVPWLSRLMAAREAVSEPAEMRRLLAEAGIELEPAGEPAQQTEEPAQVDGNRGSTAAPDASPAPASDGDLLESLLGDAPQAAMSAATRLEAGDPPRDAVLGRAIREILAETTDGTDFAAQDRWRDAIDAELTTRLRIILQDPGFRRLEAGWGALRALVRSADTDGDLRILVADFPQQALDAEIEGGVGLRDSALYELVVESQAPRPGEHALDLLITDFTFDAGARSRAGLERLAELAESAGLPILAGAGGSATAIDEASEDDLAGWSQLQGQPGAGRIGLCAPRILSREPYGAEGEPIERFRFEEGAGPGHRELYLWVSAVSGVARAAVQALSHHGELAQTARYAELEALPMHVARDEHGDAIAVGPVDQTLTESILEAWSLMGLIPVTGVRGTDTARILSLRSLARSPLMGLR